jgi:hypothetical protein
MATSVQTLTPLQPVIVSPFAKYFDMVNSMQVLEVVFALIFLVWVIYTGVVVYHWIRYSHHSWLTIPALALHVFISTGLFLFAASGFN